MGVRVVQQAVVRVVVEAVDRRRLQDVAAVLLLLRARLPRLPHRRQHRQVLVVQQGGAPLG